MRDKGRSTNFIKGKEQCALLHAGNKHANFYMWVWQHLLLCRTELKNQAARW